MTSRTAAAPARRHAPPLRWPGHRAGSAQRLNRAVARTAGRITTTILLLAWFTVLVGAPAGAQGGTEDAVHLVSVRFELAPDTPPADPGPLTASSVIDPVRYAAVQIEHRGVTRRLRPTGGVASIAVALGEEGAVVAEADGLRIGPSADGYSEALAGFVGSSSLGRFARIDAGGGESGVVLDVDLGRALGPDHYLLVQEAGGDAAVRIETLAADGRPTGAVTDLVAPYAWNTGHRSEPGVDLWATVVPVPLPAAGQPASGLRIRATTAELKVLVLEPAVDGAAAPPAESGAGGGGVAGVVAATVTPDAGSQPTDPVGGSDPEASEPGGAIVEGLQVASEPVETAVDAASASASVASATASTAGSAAASTAAAVAAPQSAAEATDGGSPASRTSGQPREVSGGPAIATATGSQATALAMTGVPTEPWILVGLATGLIFFGYTVVVAFRRPSAHRAGPGEAAGHAQLDALGFD